MYTLACHLPRHVQDSIFSRVHIPPRDLIKAFRLTFAVFCFFVFVVVLVVFQGNPVLQNTFRGIEWSLKNHGSRKILGESRNLGVAN